MSKRVEVGFFEKSDFLKQDQHPDLKCGGLAFRMSKSIFTESLILAQNERWRRV